MDREHPFHYFVGDTTPNLGNEVVVKCGKMLRIREYLTLSSFFMYAIWGGVDSRCPDCFQRPKEGGKKGNVQFVIDERMTRSGLTRRSGLDRRKV